MILIFACEQLCQQRRPGIGASKRQGGQIPDNDSFAIRQGILGAYQTSDIEFSGLVFQQFGNLLADAFAAGGNLVGFDDLVPTFQMFREDTALTILGRFLGSGCRLLTGCRG